MKMESSSDISTIDMTVPTSDAETNSSNYNKMFCMLKTKIGRHGFEQYFENFKEYITGNLKGKTSAICILCKEIVWHLKHSTSNYRRHLQRKHQVEFDL
jgi:hypothetical protein